jgi:hypothetical protein
MYGFNGPTKTIEVDLELRLVLAPERSVATIDHYDNGTTTAQPLSSGSMGDEHEGRKKIYGY